MFGLFTLSLLHDLSSNLRLLIRPLLFSNIKIFSEFSFVILCLSLDELHVTKWNENWPYFCQFTLDTFFLVCNPNTGYTYYSTIYIVLILWLFIFLVSIGLHFDKAFGRPTIEWVGGNRESRWVYSDWVKTQRLGEYWVDVWLYYIEWVGEYRVSGWIYSEWVNIERVCEHRVSGWIYSEWVNIQWVGDCC